MPRLPLAGAAALGLLSCTVATPRPARLDPKTATTITVGTVGAATTFCPGGSAVQLDVAVATTDGKVLDSWSQGESRAGKLPFATFEWTTTWGQVDADGFLQLSADPIDAIDRAVTVEVRVAERPDLSGQVTVKPDFGCGGSLGQAGAGGDGGAGGAYGSPGREGRDDDGQHAASAGEDGEDGGPGGDAGDGGPGPRVRATLGYVTTASGQRFAALRVYAGGGAQTTIFDPTGERWAVVAFGGPGGQGGSGGQGGTGGQGGDGKAPSSSSSSSSSSGSGSGSGSSGDPGTDGAAGGDGGQGGDGGRGGDGGPGGAIELTYDAAFPELADLLILDTRGGSAGGGGWGGSGGYGGTGGGGARRGYDGRQGNGGRSGPDGREGPRGEAPTIAAGDVRAAFADLEARGLTLAKRGR